MEANEQTKAQGNAAAKTSENSNAGNQPEAPLAVRQANEARERLEQTMKQLDEKIALLSELQARQALGGETSAGTPVAQKKELTPVEYAKEVMAGRIPPKK